MELTTEQTSTLIDFLKRWGLDDPMLIVEMTDHYTEKALEEMELGNSWEAILNSWKTKKTFLSLKRIEAQYKEHSKMEWKKRRWKIFTDLFKSKSIALIFGGLMATLVLMQIQYVSVIILWLVVIKAFVLVIFFICHFSFNKLKRNLYSSVKIGSLALPDYILMYHFFPLLLNWSQPVATNIPFAVFISVSIWVTIICDIVIYQVWTYISRNSINITTEMLVEWEGPKRNSH